MFPLKFLIPEERANAAKRHLSIKAAGLNQADIFGFLFGHPNVRGLF